MCSISDIPTHSDDYIHRIGRTGRAGLEGVALSLAIPADGKYIDGIERLTGMKIPRISLDGQAAPEMETPDDGDRSRDGRSRGGRNRGGRGDGRHKSGGSEAQNSTKHAADDAESAAKVDPAAVETTGAPSNAGPEPDQTATADGNSKSRTRSSRSRNPRQKPGAEPRPETRTRRAMSERKNQTTRFSAKATKSLIS